ncbi:hypothetical protein CEUSTIGMA_g13300.t1 [Chlamydomonas eustigma]|uniref:peptidylprolyl isomerase n=1 Tax=Chlamydomonas eustigma TaxID=1157962 RepID=A0A250XS52_9CHLO|nr:hypothetical protein CEUSTIGMA_g13300.t1 [Chlamydomonas eustigma]|eukprot:GAX85884.1 hypothetical protein CEUSTIGMA_g13300.t1 [Chlamydomonas eustigma]
MDAMSESSASAKGDVSFSILSEVEGFGTHTAQLGDLLLFHYVGTLEGSSQVFDSTRGGLRYRDGGPGVFRPAAVQLGSGPVPGLCQGLRKGLEGMRIGGKRTIIVSPQLGFGSVTVGAPYAVVPANSTLRYEVELIRISTRGPDELTQGIIKCGAGGAGASSENCEAIEPAEFL